MAHAFISYAREDADFAELVKMRLKDTGVDVWLDHGALRAGDDWRQAIDDGISSSATLIVVITPQSCKSPYVTYEWAFALGCGKKVIPVLLEYADIHPRLAVYQYLDFRNPQTRPGEELFREIHAQASEQAEIESAVRYMTGCSTYALLELDHHGGALHHDRISQALGRLYEDREYLRNGAAKVAASLLVTLGLAQDSGSGMVELTERGCALAKSEELKTQNKSAVERFQRAHAER